MVRLLSRLFREDDGDDLVEYALLTAFVALVSLEALNLITITMGSAYGNWDTGTQNLWEPPEPAGATQ